MESRWRDDRINHGFACFDHDLLSHGHGWGFRLLEQWFGHGDGEFLPGYHH